jgi:hypothetical protein
MTPARWGPWKLETGNSKLETGNRKLDTALSFKFPVSSFEFSLTPKVREEAEEKKYYERTHQVIENKGAHDKFTEKTRTFWFNFRTFWFKCRTFWFNVVTFWRGHAAFPIRT